jgi:hypothetical protein
MIQILGNMNSKTYTIAMREFSDVIQYKSLKQKSLFICKMSRNISYSTYKKLVLIRLFKDIKMI